MKFHVSRALGSGGTEEHLCSWCHCIKVTVVWWSPPYCYKTMTSGARFLSRLGPNIWDSDGIVSEQQWHHWYFETMTSQMFLSSLGPYRLILPLWIADHIMDAMIWHHTRIQIQRWMQIWRHRYSCTVVDFMFCCLLERWRSRSYMSAFKYSTFHFPDTFRI